MTPRPEGAEQDSPLQIVPSPPIEFVAECRMCGDSIYTNQPRFNATGVVSLPEPRLHLHLKCVDRWVSKMRNEIDAIDEAVTR